MVRRGRWPSLYLALLAASLSLGAAAPLAVIDPAKLPAPANRAVDFVDDVQPILQRHCFECHGPDKHKSGFRLDQVAFALKGGDNGVDILPGKSAESPLIHFVARLVPDMEMPPKGAPLSPEEIGILRAWIDQGAKWPAARSGAQGDDPLEWWSLRPLMHMPPPAPDSIPAAWSENPIDRFIFAKLAEKGLRPSPAADRATLIRRATYDLLGLPPAPEEVDAFVNDAQPDAYERLVDRLLASPHYGEQWGRHWLDVIRFGESRGFERNEIINSAWPFRDYVIRSLNDDKPFDRFIVEHLAGDVVGRGDPDVEIGTAFLVAGPYDDVGNQDAVQAQIIRANTVDEIITAASGAFLGLTVNCARCHNHKFDPITAEDYYRFYAIFAGVHHGERTLATVEQRTQREAQLKPLQERRDGAQKALKDFETSVLQRGKTPTEPPPEFKLPPTNPHLTEDCFEPVDVRMVRLDIFSNNRDPRGAGAVHIDEFEVWTAEPTPRNVALAAAGGKAIGPSRRPDDFADAYAPDLVNDGQYGARWIVDGPAQLTVTFASPERIDRITFSADRLKTLPADSGEIVFVGEYRIEASLDGEHWKIIADSRQRPPLTQAFARERLLQNTMTPDDREEHASLQLTLDEVNTAISRVPSLPVVWAGQFDQPKNPVCIMKGGDPTRQGAEVQPGSLSALSRITAKFELPNTSSESDRRLALARWMVQEDNPLTARVLGDRVWQYHFGVGIVDTPSDFGKLGGWPTHPELLDWLAERVHTHGWRLKPLHREMMLSQTYRQSTAWREQCAKVDGDSRLLWRFPPRRLSAEEIRDTMLMTAGVLDTRMGGPGFKLYRYLQDNVATYIPLDAPGPETYRRAVYHHNARACRLDLITEFDGPDCAFATPRRSATTSPLQALTLLNHRFTLDMARALAHRLESEAGDVTNQVRRGFVLVNGRLPSDALITESVRFVEANGRPAFCRALYNGNGMVYLE
jgi:mono/diheme cytochrome c family protein